MPTPIGANAPHGEVAPARSDTPEQRYSDTLNKLEASWMERALAKHATVRSASAFKERVRQSYLAMRLVELPIELPELSPAARSHLLEEAVRDTFLRLGEPLDDQAQHAFDSQVDMRFRAMERRRQTMLLAPFDHATLITRRLARALGWSLHG